MDDRELKDRKEKIKELLTNPKIGISFIRGNYDTPWMYITDEEFTKICELLTK